VSVSRKAYLPSHNRGIPVPKQPITVGGHLRRRRLELQIHQSEAAVRLKVSTVTLSRWECDKVYPTWEHHPRLIEYLGCDPFVSSGLRDPYGNEPPGVAFLSSATLGDRIRSHRLELKLTVKECTKKLNVDVKTLHGWEKQQHQPPPTVQKRIIEFLVNDV
jgi:transcriptional regulator with XRE-family HTH domain